MTKKMQVCSICKKEIGAVHGYADAQLHADHMLYNHRDVYLELAHLAEAIEELEEKYNTNTRINANDANTRIERNDTHTPPLKIRGDGGSYGPPLSLRGARGVTEVQDQSLITPPAPLVSRGEVEEYQSIQINLPPKVKSTTAQVLKDLLSSLKGQTKVYLLANDGEKTKKIETNFLIGYNDKIKERIEKITGGGSVSEIAG